MKPTGPTKQSTKQLIQDLKDKSLKEKQQVWKAIAEKLSKPSRQRAAINVSKINSLSKKFPEKTFIIAGKVLGNGKIGQKASVIALSYSKSAKKAIEESKGSAELLKEIAAKKFDASKLMISK